MFKEIFLFELKYRMKRPATYIYFGILFLMAYLTMLALGGAFGGGVVIGDASGGKVFANSPYQINWIVTLLSYNLGFTGVKSLSQKQAIFLAVLQVRF